MKQKTKALLTSIISVMLAVIMVAGVAPLVGLVPTASASGGCGHERFQEGNLYYEIISDNEVSIYDCDESVSGTLNIPDTVRGYNVKDINFCEGNDPFENCIKITEYAVSETNKNLTVQDGVVFNKDKTKLISYPKGSTRTSYTIPDSVITTEWYTFNDCLNLKSIKIPKSVTQLSDFTGCKNLEKIEVDVDNECYVSLDDALLERNQEYNEESGEYDYTDTYSLVRYPAANTRKEYSIPDVVTAINSYAFANCKYLKEVIVPGSITIIYRNTFSESSIEKITVSEGVKTFLYCAFAECNNLEYVFISSSVEYIDTGVFSKCPNLLNIEVSSENNVYDSVDGVLMSNSSLVAYPIGKKQNSYTVANNIKNINEAAFMGCTELTAIMIPSSVTKIGNSAFYECTNLTDIYYAGTEAEWKSIKIYDGNNPLLNATIHYNWTGEMPHVHTLQTIENPATCTVNGIRYQQCINCGEQIGEATILPALGHSWGEWKEMTPATTETEGVEERACSVCGEKETRAIPRLAQTVKDASSGIEISAPSGAYEGTLELEIEEVFDGESYNVVSTIDGAAQNKVYDITTKVDGEPSQPGKAVTVRIPLPEGYDPDRTYVYHVNSETGEVENMNVRYEDGCLVFETDHFSVYAVVEMEEERSFFGKVIDVLLGIVSLPVKLIVGLFKLIIGLFK